MERKNFPSESKDWETSENNIKTIPLKILFVENNREETAKYKSQITIQSVKIELFSS